MSDNNDLRLIYATQSIGLQLFWRLHQALAAQGALGPCGFFICNRYETTLFREKEPAFDQAGFDVLEEWPLLAEASALAAPDLRTIAEWEERIGDPTFWNGLIIDRRLGFTTKAQFRQSYTPSYSHEELLKILQVALTAIDAQFDRIRPHAVVGLNAVTLYDYLYYLMARQRGIPYFQLKLTRVRNYVSLYTDPFDLSPHIAECFRRLRDAAGDLDEADGAALDDARKLLGEVLGRTLVYEGAIKRPEAGGKGAIGKQGPFLTGARLAAWWARFRLAFALRDPHYPTLFQSSFYAKVVKPWRRRFLGGRFDVTDVGAFTREHAGRYAIYPLNTEPEVALLAYGRPYRNQIETVRNIAASLPVGWKLVVKEHPNAYGYRNPGYYRKLKQIPNVVLAGPTTDTGHLIDGCGLVALVFGTIGLEAIIKKKPLLILCETPYGVFPRSMVRYVDRLWHLGDEIRGLLASYQYDESQVEAFLAAHIRTGIRLNLFTELLSKSGRETTTMGRSVDQQYVDLAQYTRLRVAEELARIQRDRTNRQQ